MSYDNIFKKTNSLVYEVDIYKETWVPSAISESVYLLTGHKSDDFLYLKVYWKDIIHPEDLASVFKEAEVLQSPGVQLTQVYRIIHKDGSIKFIRDIKYSHLENGSLKISGIVIDVTNFQLTFRENLKKIEELTYKNDELLKHIENLSSATIDTNQTKTNNLSTREKEVLELISQGKLHKIIAFELGISIETVKSHIKNIRRKQMTKNQSTDHLSRTRSL